MLHNQVQVISSRDFEELNGDETAKKRAEIVSKYILCFKILSD